MGDLIEATETFRFCSWRTSAREARARPTTKTIQTLHDRTTNRTRTTNKPAPSPTTTKPADPLTTYRTKHQRSLTTMSGRQGGGRNKVLLPPINFIFKLLQQHSTVQIWLFEQLGMRIEGKIRGFDEFMNLVIDDAVEVKQSTKHDPNPQDGENGGRRELGMYTMRRCYL
jgi:small nuclear ribonucleoprotein E